MSTITTFSNRIYEATSSFRIQPDDTLLQSAAKLPLEFAARSLVMAAAITEIVFFTSLALITAPLYFLANQKYQSLVSRAREAAFTAFLVLKFSVPHKEALKPVITEKVASELPAPQTIIPSKTLVEKSIELIQSKTASLFQTAKEHRGIIFGTTLVIAGTIAAYYLKNSNNPIDQGVCPSNIPYKDIPNFYLKRNELLQLPASADANDPSPLAPIDVRPPSISPNPVIHSLNETIASQDLNVTSPSPIDSQIFVSPTLLSFPRTYFNLTSAKPNVAITANDSASRTASNEFSSESKSNSFISRFTEIVSGFFNPFTNNEAQVDTSPKFQDKFFPVIDKSANMTSAPFLSPDLNPSITKLSPNTTSISQVPASTNATFPLKIDHQLYLPTVTKKFSSESRSNDFPSFWNIVSGFFNPFTNKEVQVDTSPKFQDKFLPVIGKSANMTFTNNQKAFNTNRFLSLPADKTIAYDETLTSSTVDKIIRTIRNNINRTNKNLEVYKFFVKDEEYGNVWNCETKITPIETNVIEEVKQEHTLCSLVSGPLKFYNQKLFFERIAKLRFNQRDYVYVAEEGQSNIHLERTQTKYYFGIPLGFETIKQNYNLKDILDWNNPSSS